MAVSGCHGYDRAPRPKVDARGAAGGRRGGGAVAELSVAVTPPAYQRGVVEDCAGVVEAGGYRNCDSSRADADRATAAASVALAPALD